MHRRAFLGAMAASATATAVKAAAAATERPLGETGVPLQGSQPLPLGPLPGSRYPDPHVESAKKPKGAFGQSGFPGFAGTMAVERVATGMRWAEGPVYFPAGRYVLFSDIPNNRIMRYCEDDGHLSVFRQPSNELERQHDRS
jgi:gluconolactonase